MSKKEFVVFDLMGVLFHLDRTVLIRQYGLYNIIVYYIRHRKNPILEGFSLLDKMRREMEGEYQEEVSFKEWFLPLSFCKWQRGLISNVECRDKMIEFINDLDKEHFFYNAQEKSSILYFVNVMFNPECTALAFKADSPMHAMVKKLKNRNIPLYLLTNIDYETFYHIKNRYQSLFELFDGIVTSYQTHSLKPESNIYFQLSNAYDLDLSRGIFIDDQQDNLTAAQSLGLETLLYKKNDSISLNSLI